MIWFAVIAGAAGCYVLKVVGLSIPPRVLANPRVQRVAVALPVALLAALVATQTVTTGRTLVLDARAAGLAVAAVAALLRAPFLVIVVAATAAAALVRLVT